MAAATPGMNHYEKQLTPTHCTYRFSPFPLKVDETSQILCALGLALFILFFLGQNLAVFPPTSRSSRQTRVAAGTEAAAWTEAAAFAAPGVAGEGAVQAAGDVGHGQDASEDPGEDGAGEGTEEALGWLWINTY